MTQKIEEIVSLKKYYNARYAGCVQEKRKYGFII